MLRFDGTASEDELQFAILECGRICYRRNLMTSNDGNLSVRLGESSILITPSGIAKGRMAAGDIVVVNMDGSPAATGMGFRPSSELPMHLEVYKNRADIRGVIHAHPVFTTALTVAGLPFPTDVLPEVLQTLGDVPVTPYATPSSLEDAEVIRPLVRQHAAIVLRQHGTLTMGADLEEALLHLERIEHVAEVFWRAHVLGHVEHLTEDARRRLQAARHQHLKR